MRMSSACRRGTPPEYYWRCISHLLANFFFWVSRVTTPEVLTPCSFLFISKVTSVQAGHVTAAWKPKAESPLVCYPNRKTMVNNELPSFKRTNQERPYKQLLHYWSRHLRVVLEQFRFTSLFNQHLGVLVSWCLPLSHIFTQNFLGFYHAPLPRLDIQWNLYFTEPILEDGDD